MDSPSPRFGFGAALRRWWWIGVLSIPVMMIAGWGLGHVRFSRLPKKYESTVIVQCKASALQGLPGTAGESIDMISPESAIRSAETFRRVSDHLELGAKWGKSESEVASVVRSMLTVQNIPGTDLWKIGAQSINKEEACDLAEGAALAFQHLAGVREEKALTEAIKWAQIASSLQEDRVEQSLKELEEDRRARLPIDTSEYDREKEEAEMLRSRLFSLKMAKDNSQSIVVLHEHAAIAQEPVKQETKRHLSNEIVAGAVSGALLAVMITAFLGRRPISG